ncbi:SGNH/GDSL hydrolase family protein [Nakamurella silvestris]|nr:SGNH/GDSL hydrolase family protein [Nakamurella silvestris]
MKPLETPKPLPLPGGTPAGSSARILFTAAAGVGALLGATSAAWAGLQHQADVAARAIGDAAADPPRRDGVYLPNGDYADDGGSGTYRTDRPLLMAMLGDSTSAGYGADDADGLPGVMLARELAERVDRPVRLSTHATVGSRSADLNRQAREVLLEQPDLVVIVVGANDVRDRVSPVFATRMLTEAIDLLTARGVAVVVGSCPDLGVIEPIPQPLRQLAGSWSRRLAWMQERAAVKAGARAVSISRLVSPDFRHHPDFFSRDRFHPSGRGYRRAVEELLPAAIAAVAEPASH